MANNTDTGAVLSTSYLATSADGGISFLFDAPTGAGRVAVIAAMEAAAGAAYDEGADAIEDAEAAGWEVYERALTDDTYTIWAR